MELTLDDEGTHTLFGNHDENLRMLEDAFGVKISSRGNEIFVTGAEKNVAPVQKLLAEKVNPYLRPLYDSLYDIIGYDKVDKLMEKNIIEIAPLAFMRGRTLNDSFIILDEAQNTTPEQMKMFLTRLGFSSRAVVTGDVTQVDLPEGKKSGLREARNILNGVEGMKFFDFSDRDVVRHPLVAKIVVAYDRAEREQQKQ